MKKIMFIFVFLLLVMLLVQSTAFALSDIGQLPAQEKAAIEELVNSGIVSGYTDGTFRPKEALQRQHFAKYIVNALGLQTITPAKPTFPDVTPDTALYSYVEAAAKANLIKGTAGGLFEPARSLKVGELAVIIVRALESTQGGYSTLVIRAKELGLVAWDEDPGAIANRGGAAVSIFKGMQLKAEPTPLMKPSGVKAQAISSSEIAISWSQVIGADYYHVYYSNSYNGPYYGFVDENGNKSKYYSNDLTVIKLPSNTTSYYEVTAVKNGVESNYSAIVFATTFSKADPIPVSSPSGVKAQAISSSEIAISWSQVIGADYYHVYYSNSYNGPYYGFVDENGNKSKYYSNDLTVIELPSNTTSYYEVTAVKNEVESNYSDIVFATTFSTLNTLPSKSLQLVADDGTYLGKLTTNKYDLDSIFNEYGTYGSKYSSDSIWNQYGTYGSKYSSDSAFNDYTYSPPYIVTSDGKEVGRLTTNKYISGAISPYAIYAVLLELGL